MRTARITAATTARKCVGAAVRAFTVLSSWGTSSVRRGYSHQNSLPLCGNGGAPVVRPMPLFIEDRPPGRGG